MRVPIQPPDERQLGYNSAVATALGGVPPGLYGPELVGALCRLTTTVAFEVVPLRFRQGNIEVLLINRSSGVYSGEYHTPGKHRLVGQTIVDSILYLLDDEMPGLEASVVMCFGFINCPREEIGNFLVTCFCLDLSGSNWAPAIGKWVDVTGLPANTIWSHAQCLIPLAVKSFCQQLGMTNPLPEPDPSDQLQWIYMPPGPDSAVDLSKPY